MIGDSLNKVISVLQDSLSLFGTIKVAMPHHPISKKNERKNDKHQSIRIFLAQSGLKLMFSESTQKLTSIEIFLTSRKDNESSCFSKTVQWSLKGQALSQEKLSMEGVQQVMY